MKIYGKVCVFHPELDGLQYGRQRNGKPRAGTCIKCSNEQGKRWRKENPDAYRISQKKWMDKNPEKVLAKNKLYVLRHKDEIRSRNKKWREANSDYCKEKDRQKRLANPERMKEKMCQWYAKNKHLVYANNIRRRSEQIRATPAWANEFFMQEAYALAVLRSKVTGIKWSVDHIVPLRSKSVCGLHTHQNLRVIPAFLNNSKSNRYWADMP